MTMPAILKSYSSFPGELKVTNSALGFPAGHPFLQLALERLPASYRANCWDCLGELADRAHIESTLSHPGPGLLTAQLIAQYNTTRVADIPKDADVKVSFPFPATNLCPPPGDATGADRPSAR